MKKKFPLFTSNYHNRFLLLIAVISIFLGGVIYVLLRPSEAAFFQLFSVVGIEDWTGLIRENTIPQSQFFPDWFVYTLPNGLWAFAYTLLILTIWKGSRSTLKYVWIATIPVLVFGFELLQFAGFIRGTFGYEDILSGLAGIITGVLTTKLYGYEKNTVL